jgi:hypothetical protein
MAKVKGALLSFGGRGSVGKTVVYSSWKGIKYAREHVIPANPQTEAQMVVRRTFALLREAFKRAPTLVTAPWNAFASGRPFTGMNKFVGENVRVLNGEADLANLIHSPGARGGLPPESFSAAATANPGEIEGTFTVPTAPAGWTLQGAVMVAVKDQAPDGIFTGEILAAEDLTAPYAPLITGADSGDDYRVGGYLRWSKPDGTLAYSASLPDDVTPA